MYDNIIINSFIFKDEQNLNEIEKYTKNFLGKALDNDNLRKILCSMVKNGDIKFEKICMVKNGNIRMKKPGCYRLTDEGVVVKNDNIKIKKKIILKYYRSYQYNKLRKEIKKYQLKEVRQEQTNIRKYLLNTREHKCYICNKKLPSDLLEAAHLKPRCILNNHEKYDNNIAELFCLFCHKLYDKGLIGIFDKILKISAKINNFDLDYNNINNIKTNEGNEKYFNYHYKYIFEK